MNIKKLFKLFVFLVGFFVSLFVLRSSNFLAYASHCPATDYDCQIEEIQSEIDSISKAHEENKKELGSIRTQITSLTKRIGDISLQLKNVEGEILGREEDLGYAQEIFEVKAMNHYKFLRLYDPILPFLSSGDATEAFREINFRQKAADADRKTMEEYAGDLVKLKTDKENLQKSKTSLAAAQSQIKTQETFLAGEVSKVETYIGSLTSKQNELAAAKAGGFQTSVGDTPTSAMPCSGPSGASNFCDPGFRPAFAAFSFGAPHRTGMSQYGAYGRAKSGQSAETILAAYYQGADLKKDYASGATINVSGYGNISLEENYMLGIYEVPENWGNSGGFEALKAQAVAARTYALSVTNNGSGTICPTESCQVYKPQLKSGKWKEAVQATRGWVMMKGGSLATTYYASTSGGYTISQWGWSGIKDASGDWPGTAYEKMGGSPWFYMAWFKSRAGASCGRTNPWLTSDDMADVLNSWHVLYKGGGDSSRISPLDTNCWGGNPYSKDDLKNIGGYNAVSSVSVVYGNNGTTLSVSFGTNKGSISISGEELKKAFNLRAPGYIGIKSSLFNIEKL